MISFMTSWGTVFRGPLVLYLSQIVQLGLIRSADAHPRAALPDCMRGGATGLGFWRVCRGCPDLWNKSSYSGAGDGGGSGDGNAFGCSGRGWVLDAYGDIGSMNTYLSAWRRRG